MKDFFEARTLLRQLLSWKYHLLILGVLAVALSAFFSSPQFITPLFKSQARLYPANVYAHSEESASEQMLEVFSSTDLKRRMIDTFQLMERYKINPEGKHAMTHVLRAYGKYISHIKTRFETIEITVLDQDPEVACQMVDSIIAFYNDKMLELHREKYRDQLVTFRQDLKRKQAAIDQLNAQMDEFRKDGILDYELQTEQLTQGYAQALARGASRSAVDEIKKQLDQFNLRSGEFKQLQARMNLLYGERAEISKRLEDVQSLVQRKENFALMVETPYPADKKSSPTRWLIVAATLAATEFLAIFILLLLGSFKKTNE